MLLKKRSAKSDFKRAVKWGSRRTPSFGSEDPSGREGEMRFKFNFKIEKSESPAGK
jgi:hypothetical protein